MKPVVWLIGGTSESRNLIKFMAELDIILYVSVATDYGASLIEAQTNLHVMVERMDLSAMRNFITVNKPDCVIDATHPYATIVTSTVQKACEETGCEYLRLVRPAAEEHENCIIVQDFNEAVELLSHTEGNIFPRLCFQIVKSAPGDYQDIPFGKLIILACAYSLKAVCEGHDYFYGVVPVERIFLILIIVV